MSIQLELCVDSLHGVSHAARLGADRIELCASLIEGGLTPSSGLITLARAQFERELVLLVRPRGGDFCYDHAEVEVMARDIEYAREQGVDTFAIGPLTPEATPDVTAIERLRAVAGDARLTFHRAFDSCRDPGEVLPLLIDLGITRVLSSGGAATALEGAAKLRRYQELAGERLQVVAAGSVRAANARALIERSGLTSLHSAARGKVLSRMTVRGEEPSLGDVDPPRTYEWKDLSEEAARLLVETVRSSLP